MLIQKGCEVDFRSDGYERATTALHHAMLNKNVSIVKCLVDAGAEVKNAFHKNGRTHMCGLGLVVERGDRGIIRALVKSGADLDDFIDYHDISSWPCADQMETYRYLCTLAGRSDALEGADEMVTHDMIIEEADRGLNHCAMFQKKQQTSLDDELLEYAF
ncbi:hypothetical protein B0H63DRAFT_221273 [Podospora didyma]|uniref:Ankyrin repeat protein n=1 Tax=Podospora didyma TaxID=330526 RepID=A0AAE0KJ27_9PEZI|nr:hypothetical protein B0H63DRAFT_221273 [Podospora didyma]